MAEMKQYLVSVVMPTYNCGRYIREAVESVKHQQVEWELIIIDDASTDDTEKKIEDYEKDKRIHYIRNSKNEGVAKSRNQGCKCAKGEYIAFLDADDWWKIGKLKKQIEKMKKTNAVLCYTGRELFDEKGKSKGKIIRVKERLYYSDLLKTNSIACSSVVVKREAILEFPMEHDELHEDYLTWLRVLEKYDMACGINEPLLCTRLTKDGKSRKKWKTVFMTYGVYRQMRIGKIKSFWYVGRHIIRSGLKYLKGS